MLHPLALPRSRRALRAGLIALAVLVLVPAWVARSVYVYACATERAMAAKRCCPAKKAPPEAPQVKAACCAADRVELPTRTAAAPHDEPIDRRVEPPAIVVAYVDAPAPPVRVTAPPPRATGPPIYLETRSLLL